MQTFHLEFDGTSENNKDYGCKMVISGDTEIIGRMLAEYATHEMRRGHNEVIQILIAAFKNMTRLNPGVSEGGIILPN